MTSSQVDLKSSSMRDSSQADVDTVGFLVGYHSDSYNRNQAHEGAVLREDMLPCCIAFLLATDAAAKPVLTYFGVAGRGEARAIPHHLPTEHGMREWFA